MRKLRFDIDCENFDHYFANQVDKISAQAKESLPKQLQFKIFRKGGIFNATSDNKLGFLAKLFILVRALRKRWILIVEDENGMSEDQYFEYKKRLEKRRVSIELSEDFKTTGDFVLGSTELINAFSRLNLVSVSPAYNFLVKSKNTEVSKSTEYSQQMGYLYRMLSFYESNKKKWVMQTGLSIPEYLVLAFIYDRGEVVSSQIYKDVYKYAYNSSSTQIKMAFGSLQKKGLIEKFGYKKGVSIKITELGKDLLHEIASKYIIDF